MADTIDLNGGLELHDRQGRKVGVVLPADAAAELTAERDRLRQEVERLRAELLEARRALDAAREELKDKAEIASECEMYRKSLEAIYAKDAPSFTAEDIAEADKHGLTLDQFIHELENPQPH
jgi:hypothetical protein